MKTALSNLKKQICSLKPAQPMTEEKWREITPKCTVALMAGGESSRFSPVTGETKANKNSFKLPNNDTMLEMAIRMYQTADIKNFIALVFHQGQSVEELLGDGTKLRVNIKYSYDPEKPVGKGGAIKNALENKSIPIDHYLIVHNPDDVILDYPGSFPKDILSGHLENEKAGAEASVVIVEETPYTFSGMKINQNLVEQIEMYPMIPLPTHIGVTIFSPQCLDYFLQMFDYAKKADFEKELFPALAQERKLSSVSIPPKCWLAINNPKSYNELLERLGIK